MTTRAEFMARVRDQVRGARPLFPAAVASRPEHPGERLALLRRELSERRPATLARFRREFEQVGGVFHHVARPEEVAGVLAGLARERDARTLVSWHPRALGADLDAALRARGLEPVPMPREVPGLEERARLRAAAASADLGLTGVDLAIAQTGTLVVVSGPGRPRSTSLLPAVHVALLAPDALVESLDQAGLVLEAWHAAAAPAGGGAVTFITGPSRTADIELTLTRGVHGPKEVHVVVVDAGLVGDRG